MRQGFRMTPNTKTPDTDLTDNMFYPIITTFSQTPNPRPQTPKHSTLISPSIIPHNLNLVLPSGLPPRHGRLGRLGPPLLPRSPLLLFGVRLQPAVLNRAYKVLAVFQVTLQVVVGLEGDIADLGFGV